MMDDTLVQYENISISHRPLAAFLTLRIASVCPSVPEASDNPKTKYKKTLRGFLKLGAVDCDEFLLSFFPFH
jgi:hypothetical protein